MGSVEGGSPQVDARAKVVNEYPRLPDPRQTKARYGIVAFLFILTTVNYADRATMSVAGSAIQKQLGLSSVTLGYIFSAFAWAYVVGQVPGGVLLDRFGSKRVYTWAIVFWSSATFMQGFVPLLGPAAAAIGLFSLRFLLGLGQSPSFPGNARIVAAWFPHGERGTASAIFNSAQYAALILFAPVMGWLTDNLGWQYVFFGMGTLGLLAAAGFSLFVHAPHSHPRINAAEFEHIAANGALVDLDRKGEAPGVPFNWGVVRQLLTNRMLVGIYIAQYCTTALTYFFSTWFTIYLVKGHGLTASVAGVGAAKAATFGIVGGLLGGFLSDWLIKRGKSITYGRKTPLVVGMTLAIAIVLCNLTKDPALITVFMGIAFFGKGLASLGWAIIADAAPREVTGLSGGIFNTIGNAAGITTPVVIGYLVDRTGSFDLALVFVAGHCVFAMLSYLLVVGPIRRIALKST